MQIANSFDSESIKKIKHSALVVAAGIALIVLPFFLKELSDWITVGDPVDWRTMITMALGGLSTWFVNTLKVYVQGEEPKIE